MVSKQHEMFKLLTTLPVDPSDKLSQEIADHLKLLRKELMHYFPHLVSCTYALNPSCIDPGEQEEIIDIQVDRDSKSKEEGMLFYRFMANNGLHLPNIGPKCCSSATSFPLVMGV